jgi:hypothetical protein
MLIELFSLSNYGHFNIRLASLLGLEEAVYLNELLSINEKAMRKDKIERDFFIVDRGYISSRTTLDDARQRAIDDYLESIGVVERALNNKDAVRLDITILTDLIMSPSEQVTKDLKTKKSRTTRKTKKEVMIESLKNRVVTSIPELRTAYYTWIESSVEGGQMLNATAVTAAQTEIDEIAKSNLEVAIKIIEIATINSYRDMHSAVNAYMRNYGDHYKVAMRKQEEKQVAAPRNTKRLSSDVF